MNKHVYTTEAASASSEFPIVHCGQTPDADMRHVMMMLELATMALEEDRGGSADRPIFAALCDITLQLEPIMRFLDDLDYKGMTDDYAAARRAVILENWKAAQ